MKRVTIILPQNVWTDRRTREVSHFGSGMLEIRLEGEDITIDEKLLDKYVQVEFIDPHPVSGQFTRQLFTYRVRPSETYKIGDIVEVTTRYELSGARAVVRRLDSGIGDAATNYVSRLVARAPRNYRTPAWLS